MDSLVNAGASRPCYELRFQDLFRAGRALTFPCDDRGRVDLDALSDRARRAYAYAQSAIGRELAMPDVQLAGRA